MALAICIFCYYFTNDSNEIMKRQIDKKILFQILLAIIVCVLITITSGCRTGGVKLNPNSAGKVLQSKSPKQINEETKARREESQKFAQAKAQPTKPLDVKSSKTQPTPPTPTPPVEIKVKPNEIKAAGSATQVSPTVSPSTNINLPPAKVTGRLETISLTVLPESKGDANNGVIVTNQKSVNEMNWIQLFSLFMILFTGALILWVAYDIIKDIFNMKKQGTPMRDHLQGLKKPAKSTRASRKKAAVKKRPLKKKG